MGKSLFEQEDLTARQKEKILIVTGVYLSNNCTIARLRVASLAKESNCRAKDSQLSQESRIATPRRTGHVGEN